MFPLCRSRCYRLCEDGETEVDLMVMEKEQVVIISPQLTKSTSQTSTFHCLFFRTNVDKIHLLTSGVTMIIG
jgi:hypothetical protein